jgi:hypothetical protein|nr:MAG TPA: hypothetical protein [Caudoviricetes sp.]
MSKKSGDVIQEYVDENGQDGKYYVTREDITNENGDNISIFTISGSVDVAPLTSNKYESHQYQLEESINSSNNTIITVHGNNISVNSPKSNTLTTYTVKESEQNLEEAVEDNELH